MPDTDRLAPQEIRTLFLFEALDDVKLDWLAEHGRVEERRSRPPASGR